MERLAVVCTVQGAQGGPTCPPPALAGLCSPQPADALVSEFSFSAFLSFVLVICIRKDPSRIEIYLSCGFSMNYTFTDVLQVI